MVGVAQHPMIAGNVYEVLKEVRGVGQEAASVGGIVQTPTSYCPGVLMTAKGSWNGFERSSKAL
jgi:predicted Zn-dependent protease